MNVILYFAGDSAASGQARLHLRELRGEFEFELVEFDIEHEPDLRRQFQSKAPVAVPTEPTLPGRQTGRGRGGSIGGCISSVATG